MKRWIHASTTFVVDESYLEKYFKKTVPPRIRKQAAKVWKDYIDAEGYESNPGLDELESVINAIDSQEDFAAVMYSLGYYDREDYEAAVQDDNAVSHEPIDTEIAAEVRAVFDIFDITPSELDLKYRSMPMYHFVPGGISNEEAYMICLSVYEELLNAVDLPNPTLRFHGPVPSGSFICWGEDEPGGIIIFDWPGCKQYVRDHTSSVYDVTFTGRC